MLNNDFWCYWLIADSLVCRGWKQHLFCLGKIASKIRYYIHHTWVTLLYLHMSFYPSAERKNNIKKGILKILQFSLEHLPGKTLKTYTLINPVFNLVYRCGSLYEWMNIRARHFYKRIVYIFSIVMTRKERLRTYVWLAQVEMLVDGRCCPLFFCHL